MSLISLYNSEHLSLLSDQLIYSAEETGSLKNVLDKTTALNDTLAQAENHIQTAHDTAVKAGFREGFNAGKAQGLKEAHQQASESRLSMHHKVQQSEQEIRIASIELALQIVQRIGLAHGNAKTIHALAEQAALSVRPDEPVKLHVNPEHLDSIQELNTRSEVTVTGDESLGTESCLLTWPDGKSVEADLTTQLDVIKQHLLQTA